LQIAGLDGESDILTLLCSILLIGGSGPNGGIKSDIGGFTISGTRLDVATTLTFGFGTRTTPRLPAGEPVDGGVDVSGNKCIPSFYFFSALPPVGVSGVEDILFGGFGRGLLLGRFVGDARGYLTGFFFTSSASESSGAGCVSSDSI
jgi:hypothetical protein